MSFPTRLDIDILDTLDLPGALGVVPISVHDDPRHDLQATSTINGLYSEHALIHLHTLHLDQVIFLHPMEVAQIACSPALPALSRFRVVDAYMGSIWGHRVRMVDVERAIVNITFAEFSHEFPATLHTPLLQQAFGFGLDADVHDAASPVLQDRLRRARGIVSCEAKTERLMGGDRMDATHETT